MEENICEVKDPFFIYKMNDESMSGEQTFVFKMSWAQADLALAMDRSTDNDLKDEYCFGDGTFARSAYVPSSGTAKTCWRMEIVLENVQWG